MSVTDPGTQFPYLKVVDNGDEFMVWKECRVRIFDPFWVTEPVLEEDKPLVILRPHEVPVEL